MRKTLFTLTVILLSSVFSFATGGEEGGNNAGYQPIEKKLCATRWFIKNTSGLTAILHFGKDGQYKCVIDNALPSSDSIVATWKLRGDSVLLTFKSNGVVQPEPFRAKIFSITDYELVFKYNGIVSHYYSEFISVPPQEIKLPEQTVSTPTVQPVSKKELYSKFIGTYHLKKSEGIEYDKMTFRYKEGEPTKLECVRTYRFKNLQTGKVGQENVQVYEVVKLDSKKHKITLKYGDKEATYNFFDNNCGGYDLVIFDQVLVYSCNKQ